MKRFIFIMDVDENEHMVNVEHIVEIAPHKKKESWAVALSNGGSIKISSDKADQLRRILSSPDEGAPDAPGTGP
jgi:hypothetical protein